MLNNIAAFYDSGAAPILPSDFESIATVTVGSGGSSSISFTSIVGTYSHLQIRGLMGCSGGAGSSVNVSFNGNTTSTDYYFHRLQGTGSAAASGSGNIRRLLDNGGSSTYFQGAVIDILDYSNTNKFKTSRALAGYDANGSGTISLTSNLWKFTNAITQIDLSPDSGTFVQYSSFALYGIK
jgi:hypothetical protein